MTAELTMIADIREKVLTAKGASRDLAARSAAERTTLVQHIALFLREAWSEIETANAKDLAAAHQAGLASPVIDRLRLDEARFAAMISGVEEVAALADPVGEELSIHKHRQGFVIRKVRVPIGVIFIIYESRPNVTADAASLCLRAGNAVVLRGGSESRETNRAIVATIHRACRAVGISENVVTFVDSADRNIVKELLQMDNLIDLVIPRGGESLIRAVVENSRIPVVKHYKGVCHVFVDSSADFDVAEKIIVNAKCQRPGVCNAMETLLVHRDVAPKFLPRIVEALRRRNVELRGDERTRAVVSDMAVADEEDWSTEYLDLILSIRVVESAREAIEHINHFGSHHSDAIVTTDAESAKIFLRDVDSAAVYVNVSTRFTDGAEFGMGAEIGISTDKLHARGPMGVQDLTTYKFVVDGTGQVRE